MAIEDTYRLPFDQFQRYRLVAEATPILEGEGPKKTILEAGGYPPRLRDFLPEHKITTVDRIECSEPDYVCASAVALPFPDKNFGIALSLDTLEHVPPADRDRFLGELCRVSESYVIVAAPFASEAVKAADRAIFEFIRDLSGYEHPYLKEHLELEPPDLVATVAKMADAGLDVQVIPSGRLDRWMMMMAAYYTLDADPDLKASLPFFMEAYNRAFYAFDKAEPAYRHFLIGAYQGLGKRWSLLAELASGEAAEKADTRGMELVMELARVTALKRKDRELAGLSSALRSREDELASLRDHVRELEDFAVKVKSLPLYRFYERFVKPLRSS